MTDKEEEVCLTDEEQSRKTDETIEESLTREDAPSPSPSPSGVGKEPSDANVFANESAQNCTKDNTKSNVALFLRYALYSDARLILYNTISLWSSWHSAESNRKCADYEEKKMGSQSGAAHRMDIQFY